VFPISDSVKAGTLIIAEGLSLPMSNAQTQSFFAGWRTVKNVEASGMDKSFSEMGWSCFAKASPVTVNLVGLGHAATLIKAFQKLVRQSKTAKFNCLEILEAVHKTFMGVSFVRLTVRTRNIKQRLW
jgi:hypothetical protein